VASLPSILILGADAVAAANPATAVQLVHACRAWGFSAVVPASWGDELIAGDVIQRCAGRVNKPVIQCSCPRVSDRLSAHAATLDDAILWLIPPPVAVAKYLRAIEPGRDIHVTYAGGCPGATDASIDEAISPFELLAAISARGIDLASQPTVFDDLIPADRRRHYSSPGGLPEPHCLWDAANFRVAQPATADLAVHVAQLLLRDERVLIDLSPTLGCVCRTAEDRSADATSLQRSTSPVVTVGKVDVTRAAPSPPPQAAEPYQAPRPDVKNVAPEAPQVSSARPSQTRPSYRRQSTWRRQSPRPGVVVARTSAVLLAVNDTVPFMRRPTAQLVMTAVLLTAALMIAFWVGRRTSPTATSVGAGNANRPTLTQLAHSRSH
jgi:hypothetical protein